MLPFKEKILEENENYILVQRIFDSSKDEELIWHIDKEDREVTFIEGDGWYIQIENEIPQSLNKKGFFKIPKETWHRIINSKKTKLILNIRKYK